MVSCVFVPPAVRGGRSSLRRGAWLLAGTLLLPVAGAAEEAGTGGPAPAASAAAADPYSGTYEVLGLTVDQKTGDTRRITGHLVLTRKNGHWAASAELETDFPTHGGPLRTDVIGTGEGQLKAGGLQGTARTQLVIQTVPGVDTDFAFIPRQVGPRLVSNWSARLEPDGTLVVELSNRGEKGEAYAPTRTTLRGKRVAMPNEEREGATAP